MGKTEKKLFKQNKFKAKNSKKMNKNFSKQKKHFF